MEKRVEKLRGVLEQLGVTPETVKAKVGDWGSNVPDDEEIQKSGTMAVFGPTGSGKTQLVIRLILTRGTDVHQIVPYDEIHVVTSSEHLPVYAKSNRPVAERITPWARVGEAAEHLLRVDTAMKRALVIEWGELYDSMSRAANSTALRNLVINARSRNLLIVFVAESLQQLPRWIRMQTDKLCSPFRTLIPELMATDLTHLKDLIPPAAMSRLEILCAYPDAVPSGKLFEFMSIIIDRHDTGNGCLVWSVVPLAKVPVQ